MAHPAQRPPTSVAPRPHQEPELPINVREGAASVGISSEHEAVRLVRDPLARTIWRVGTPAVASSLLMTVFASVDAFWVGTRVGPAGLAAVSTALFWVWLTVAIAEMVSVGLTAVAARRHGERRHDEAALVVGDALLFALALGTLVAAVGTFALDALFAAMRTPPAVTALGARYLHTYLLGAPLIFGFFAVDAGFRAAGNTRTPFLILALSVAITLVLDPVLILGLLGVPKLGIAGAAIATVSTRAAAFVMGLVLLIRRRLIRLRVPRLASVIAVCRVGLPTALTGVLFSTIYVILTRTTTRFGTPALAALGLGHRVESWFYMIGVGFGAAAAAIVGQNLGAGRPDRAARAGWITVAYASAPGLLALALMVGVPTQLAAVFTSDPAVVAETARYLRIAAVAQLFVAAEVVLEGALGGAGDTVPPMLTSTAIIASRIPIAAWAATRFGTAGIWWTITLTAVARGLALMVLWRSGRWTRRKV